MREQRRSRDAERVVESGLARLSSERALPAWESFPERSSTTVPIWPAHSPRTAFHRRASSGVTSTVAS